MGKNNTNNNNSVTERIDFLPDGTIDRAYPVLIGDTGKLTLHQWSSFCDAIDKETAQIRKSAKSSETMLWIFTILTCFVFSWMWCWWEDYYYPKHTSIIRKELAKFANQIPDLSLALVGKSPEKWYIEATVRNVRDVETDVEQPIAAVATATPVVPVATPILCPVSIAHH